MVKRLILHHDYIPLILNIYLPAISIASTLTYGISHATCTHTHTHKTVVAGLDCYTVHVILFGGRTIVVHTHIHAWPYRTFHMKLQEELKFLYIITNLSHKTTEQMYIKSLQYNRHRYTYTHVRTHRHMYHNKCDRICEKGSYSLSSLTDHNYQWVSPITFKFHQLIVLC